jgi:hypothetical protein
MTEWRELPRTLGGPGSGNFGHSGRPGEVGGSGEGFDIRYVAGDSPILVRNDAAGVYSEKDRTVYINEKYKGNEHLLNHEIGHALTVGLQPSHWAEPFREDAKAWDEFKNTSVGKTYLNYRGGKPDDPYSIDWMEAQADLYMLWKAGKLDDSPRVVNILKGNLAYRKSTARTRTLGSSVAPSAGAALLLHHIVGRLAGGPGSGWTAENGHVPGSQGGAVDMSALLSKPVAGWPSHAPSDVVREEMRAVSIVDLVPTQKKASGESFVSETEDPIDVYVRDDKWFIGDGHNRVVNAVRDGKTEIAAHVTYLKSKIKALGGPGSGNFGHAGRPGEVGGSSPSGDFYKAPGGGKASAVGADVRTKAEAVARKLGFKGKVRFSKMPSTTLAGRELVHYGFYDPRNGTITINPGAGTLGLKEVMSHEVTHDAFHKVIFNASLAELGGRASKSDRDVYKYMQDHMTTLAKEDGVTSYSREYWKAAKGAWGGLPEMKAVNETLAEISRVGPKGVSEVWGNLHRMLMRAYRSR